MSESTPLKGKIDSKAPARAVAYRYIGNGAALADVPARDLFEDELSDIVRGLIARSGQNATEEQPILTDREVRKLLIASGLYEKAGG